MSETATKAAAAPSKPIWFPGKEEPVGPPAFPAVMPNVHNMWDRRTHMELIFHMLALRSFDDAKRALAAEARAAIEAAKKRFLDESEAWKRYKRLAESQAATVEQEKEAAARMKAALVAAQDAIARGVDPSAAESDYAAAKMEDELLANRLQGAARAVEEAQRQAAASYHAVLWDARRDAVRRLEAKAEEAHREACQRLKDLVVKIWAYPSASAELSQMPLDDALPDPLPPKPRDFWNELSDQEKAFQAMLAVGEKNRKEAVYPL